MSNSTFSLSDQQILQVLSASKNAVAIHVTEQMHIAYASDAMIAIWGKDKGVIGKALLHALPELKGQPFLGMFQQVLREGITIEGTETAAQIEVNGKMQTFYFDFEYKAIKDETGKPYCVLHTATDVTERYLSKQRELALNQELVAINEEFFATNEELTAANEELRQSQESLQAIYEDLTESDARFRNMVRQAPIGICIIRASDLYISDVNDSYLELVGKTRYELEGRTIWQAVPEAAEAYAPIMNNVITTGTAFVAKEAELVLIRSGVPETVFVDFVYEPIKATDGETEAIMVLAIDVSDKVIARRSVEDVEERVRLAVEAAEIGTFDLDLVKGAMLTSTRFDHIFGFDRQVPWDTFVSVIHPDDQAGRKTAHEQALKTGKLFYEARVIHGDASVHWVRVQGKVYYADEKPVRILGTLLDITQFKRLQQQKDDFISIASHELKTPITSLKASLQLLDRMKHDPPPKVLPRLVEQSNRSMHKISTLVEDLLNVSRANETQLKLNKATFNISQLLENCCNHVRVGGKYSLIVEGDKELQINADEHAIDQVIVNLVNNAVKYAPDSLEIIIAIKKEGNMAKISVKDTGPGISPDKLPHLFDRYYQIDAAGYQNSGLGLGLYISREIIKRHGGKIGVDSELGKGSTFWFILPL